MTRLARTMAAVAVAATALTALTTLPRAATAAGGHKVLVFVEENHSAREALSKMPYLNWLGYTYGRASHYKALSHPSLPNYFGIAGGSVFGVTDDADPSSHHIHGQSVFDQTIAAGLTARTYAESMPKNCYRSDYGRYAVRHNPWTYYVDAGPRANCARFDVPAGGIMGGTLQHDIVTGNLPTTGFVVPDTCDDAHDSGCSLARADTYLGRWMWWIRRSPDWQQGRLTVIVTFDEDDGSANNTVAFVVADPRLHGRTVGLAADHYALTRWIEDNAGVPRLYRARYAPNLKGAFGL